MGYYIGNSTRWAIGDFFDASTGAVKEVLAWVEKSFEHYG